MNIDNLAYAYNNSILTDLELVLDDDKMQISINVHKIILFSGCKYFINMFTNFKEKSMGKIEVKVPNASVSHEIIMSFYGFNINIKPNDWENILWTIICKNFFMMPNELEIDNLLNMDIPIEGMDLLLYLEKNIKYNQKILAMITFTIYKNNFFPIIEHELLQELINYNKNNYNQVIIINENKSILYDIINGIQIDVICEHNNNIILNALSNDNKMIMTLSTNYNENINNAVLYDLKICNLVTKKCTTFISLKIRRPNSASFINNDKCIIFVSFDAMYIYDITTRYVSIISSQPGNDYKLLVMDDDTFIIDNDDKLKKNNKHNLQKWIIKKSEPNDKLSGKLISSIPLLEFCFAGAEIFFSQNKKLILYAKKDKNIIEIYNANNCELQNIIKTEIELNCFEKIFFHNDYIIFAKDMKSILFMDIKTGKFFRSFNHDRDYVTDINLICNEKYLLVQYTNDCIDIYDIGSIENTDPIKLVNKNETFKIKENRWCGKHTDIIYPNIHAFIYTKLQNLL